MFNNKINIVFVIISVLFMACNQDTGYEPAEIDLDLKSQQLVEADNTFGFDVFQRINEIEKDNFCISPLSISLALAMTYNGAEGETKTQMENALKVAGLSTEEINKSYQLLIDALLNADSKVTMEIAQSIWYNEGFNVLEEFKQVNQTYYDAEVNELDFSRSDAKEIVNGWIEDKTHDKIKDMIDRIGPEHVMFLINAIYFNGIWQTEFKKVNTDERTFYLNNGETLMASTMQKEDSVLYASNELFSSVILPYGHGNFNMTILLPGEGKTCSDITAELNSDNWNSWMKAYSPQKEVNIFLPKFKTEYEIKLNKILKAMGMELAFTGAADFSGINGSGGIYIDYVQHNTFIDVNEKGTEAAAATVVAMKYTAMPSSVVFNANRPFIYAITEKETGAILFIGKMTKPSYE